MKDLAFILEAIPAGIWVGKVPDGAAVYSNPAFERIMGMGAVAEANIDAAPGTYGIFDRAGNVYPVENLPFSRVMASGEPVIVDDIVIHRPDGKKANIRAFGHPAFDASNQMTHVVVAFFDITREVKAEVEREQTEARLSLAVNHAPIAIWSTDRAGVITVSEGAGLASLGVKSGQLVGMNIFDLYKDHPSISGYVRRGLAGESFWYTVQVGEAIYDTWMTPIRDASGQIMGVAALSNDVSEIRRLQSTAIQNDRVIALGTLAASVAHEINNPITYMLGHARRLQGSIQELEQIASEGPAAQRERLTALATHMRTTLETLTTGTERIAAITRDLQTFSRSDTEESARVDLRTVAGSVLKLVAKEIEARAELRVELNETWPVRGNEPRLVQVILNLIVNAIQALSDVERAKAEVTVRTYNDGEHAVVEVSDSGLGVPVERRERIFEPFMTTKDVGVGTGLGLFVSRNIVRALGGDLTLSDQPGGGARFRVTLPRQISAFPTPSKRHSIPPTDQPVGNILVIDDEPLVAQSLCTQLIAAGYHAQTEQDAARALTLLVEDGASFDLVYCDLMMKGMTGMDLAEALQERNAAALHKVVFMTGGAFTPRARNFFEANAPQCLEKPFNVLTESERRLRKLRQR